MVNLAPYDWFTAFDPDQDRDCDRPLLRLRPRTPANARLEGDD
ncbi:hypothetical protein [Streptomyces sp. NPDC086519]